VRSCVVLGPPHEWFKAIAVAAVTRSTYEYMKGGASPMAGLRWVESTNTSRRTVWRSLLHLRYRRAPARHQFWRRGRRRPNFTRGGNFRVAMTQNLLLADRATIDRIGAAIREIQAHGAELARA
jgi:hypothetical protein